MVNFSLLTWKRLRFGAALPRRSPRLRRDSYAEAPAFRGRTSMLVN